MANEPNANFEAHFIDGTKIYSMVSSNLMKIKCKQGLILEIDLADNSHNKNITS